MSIAVEEKHWLSAREVALLLDVHEDTVRRWMDAGNLKFELVGSVMKTTYAWLGEYRRANNPGRELADLPGEGRSHAEEDRQRSVELRKKLARRR